MSQWFLPAKPSNRRDKILIWGLSGSAKTKSALEFPQCAYIDNHGSAEKYASAYPQHLFFGSAGEPPTPDNTMAAVTSLLSDPGDRRTLVLDDITTYWDQLQGKWEKTFRNRLPKSPGHHAEFYTFQPSDWQHPKRELRSLIRRAIALDTSVVFIARAQKEYAGEGKDYMKVVGEIFAGEKNIVYEFDYVFQFTSEATETGTKYTAIVHKQRVTPGEKPMPSHFEFHIKKGRSTFYDEFSKYVDKDRLNQEPHQVADPVKEEWQIDSPEAVQQAMVQEQAAEKAVEHLAEQVQTTTTAPLAGEIQSITKDQLDQLVALKKQFIIQKEEWDSLLTKFYNVTTARALTQDQGKHFINYLLTQRIPF